MRPGLVIVDLWLFWILTWLAAAAWSNRTEKRPAQSAERGYNLIAGLGALIMCVPAHRYEGPLRLWHVGWNAAWLCAALVAVGIAFAWWARLHLGRLWSARVTLKQDHRIVDTGPYALVRHPIYSGLLLALLATAVAKGTIPGVAGFALLTCGIWLKAGVEEHWLSDQLGADNYADYQKRVPKLIPMTPTG